VRLQINYVARDGVLSADQLALVPPVGILSLKIIAGRKLMAKDDDTGASDPFCQVRIIDMDGKEALDYESDTVKETVNPRWKNQKFYFRLDQTHDHLEIEVRDADQLKSQFLGFISMPLKELNVTPSAERWIKLGRGPTRPTRQVAGDLLVRWNFTRTQALRTQAMVDAEALAQAPGRDCRRADARASTASRGEGVGHAERVTTSCASSCACTRTPPSTSSTRCCCATPS
jgi:Ca2+-dependent lipid-binding protein